MRLAQGKSFCAGAMARLGAVALAAALAAGAGAAPAADDVAELMSLVDVNEQYQELITQADELLKEGKTAEAIRAYQNLLIQGRNIPSRAGDRRFLPVSWLAARRLGSLSTEGLTLYRRLYDPPARQLFNRARRDLDRPVLARIVANYYHTSVGDRARDLLATLQFDEGRFDEAARNWERLLDRPGPQSIRREVLLAKAAVAWHLAGVGFTRDRRVLDLTASYGDAEATLAGRRQNLLAFVAAVCKLSAPAWTTARPKARRDWPCLAGSADGMAVMSDCDVAAKPHWTTPRRELDLERTPELLAMLRQAGRGGAAELSKGRLIIPREKGEKGPARTLTPITHPIVVADKILIRTHSGVVAFDLLTGEKLCERKDLPMVVSGRAGTSMSNRFVSRPGPADLGRYSLTVGEDLLFLVTGFTASRNRFTRATSESSALVALRLSSGLRERVWLSQACRDEGQSEAVGGKFLGAPTYADGRVYAVATFREQYYLLCLEAPTGRHLWQVMIGQAPAVMASRYGGMMLRPVDRGSPPAVSRGRVFVTTNAGLIAAYAADDGRHLWTYQYGQATLKATGVYRRGWSSASTPVPMPKGTVPVPNPLIVVGEKVLALPADSDKLIALDAQDGTPLWQAASGGQRTLTAINRDQVLLSGPALVVLSTADGGVIWPRESTPITGVFGRPAVTPSAIIASSPGRLVRVTMRGGGRFALEGTQPLNGAGLPPLLGNLLSIDGKLVAAYAGSVSVYIEFDKVHGKLTERLAGTSGLERAKLLLERGRLALGASQQRRAEADGRLPAALADLLAVRAYSRSVGSDGAIEGRSLDARVRTPLRQTYIRMANLAEKDAETGRLLRLAAAEANTPVTRGEMLIRMIRYHERCGRPAEAARCAQELAERHADDHLRDVNIGPVANDRWSDELPQETGYELGHRHIARLIELHGREVYAAFDAKAKAALTRARASGDTQALQAARRRYRYSQWVAEMLLTAAETLYTGNARDSRPRTDQLGEALALLGELVDEFPDSPWALNAKAGQALIQLQTNPAIAQSLCAYSFTAAEKARRAKFGDFDGPVRQLLEKMAKAAGQPVEPAPAEPMGALAPPLRRVYQIPDATARILRDPRGQAVQLGPRVLLLLSAGGLTCLDMREQTPVAGAALQWTTRLTDEKPPAPKPDGEDPPAANPPPPKPAAKPAGEEATGGLDPIGHLLDGGRTVAVIAGGALHVFDTDTGRMKQRHALAAFGLAKVTAVIGHGDRIIFGRADGALQCIRIAADGEAVKDWSAAGADNRGPVRLRAGGGYVVCVNLVLRRARCYDVRSGKLRHESRSPDRSLCDAGLTADGILVVLKGREMSAYDPRRQAGAGPLWREQLASARPILLGISATRIAFAPEADEGVVAFRLIATGQGRRRVAIGQADGMHYPIHADFIADDEVVLSCGAAPRGKHGGGRGYAGTALPTILLANAKTGQIVWEPTPIHDGRDVPCALYRPVIGDGHLVVLHKPLAARHGYRYSLVNRANGRGIPEAALAAAGAAAVIKANGDAVARHAMLGPPVIAGGRVLLESPQGIVLLDSRRSQ